MTIRRLFIANRGEIAVRVIQTCKRLGIQTVLAVSTADRNSLGAVLADRVVCIGPAHAKDSYLKVEAVIEAALRTQADAIHPGYGFLSENPALAKACDENGIIFVGPTAEQIARVGDKLEARRIAVEAGLPVVPGGHISSMDDARSLASHIGFPILVKAVAGGGGRGMKLIHHDRDVGPVCELAMAEAAAAFGDGRVYLEKFIAAGRHIEVQLLGDGENVIHLGDRDCSVQRRYQKLIEESPAPHLDAALRHRLHEAAVRFAASIGYRSLGTVEFLVDTATNEFYFLEMNARIQVEHPVTEAVTGLDLVAEQIRIAEGNMAGLLQQDLRIAGHAIECRLNAEDIERDFAPNAGTITSIWFPSSFSTRIDTCLESGSVVPPFYDSMVAKVIVHGGDRAEALQRMRDVLRCTRLAGVKTNIRLHEDILVDPEFVAGGVETGFLPRFLERRNSAVANQASVS